MLLFKRFVKPHADEIQDKKRKDPETIEELDRQLKYMENYIGDFKSTSQKNHQKSIGNIKQRTEENRELIDELSSLRTEQKKRNEELNKRDMEIQEMAQRKKHSEFEIEKIREQIREIKQQEDR